ncbi:MAG: uracil phosphoribosyltransferase [Bacteroidales bacterium]|nr:uracil phosphoribosyltransferase [Bacteroidales bacterium]
MVTVLQLQNSLANTFLAELRNINIQQDSLRFRKNLERLGEVFAYEISKKLAYTSQNIDSPLGIAPMMLPSQPLVIATILRAGLPFHQGILNFFDHAESAFVSAYRKTEKDGSFEIQLDYISAPDLNDKVLILADPMLATGQSVDVSLKGLFHYGMPSKIHVVSVISTIQGINYLKSKLPHNADIWTVAIDEELTAQSYIVPGLGDAGDLAFGEKMSF